MRVQREVDTEEGLVTLSFELPLGMRADLAADLVFTATYDQLVEVGCAQFPPVPDVQGAA